MQSRFALTLLVVLGGLVACAPDKGFETRDISRADYEEQWPLAVDAAVLACEPGGVPTVTVDGTTYGLDTADEQKMRPASRLDRILADGSGGQRMDASVLLQDALALCE